MKNLFLTLALVFSGTLFCQEFLSEPFIQYINIEKGAVVPDEVWIWKITTVDANDLDSVDSLFAKPDLSDEDIQLALYKIKYGESQMKVYFDRPGVYVVEGHMYDETPINIATSLVISDDWVNTYKDNGKTKINKDGVLETTTSIRVLHKKQYSTYKML
jgi:hypothetical protein|tara:strand:+ start:450 stop:926 length:477 start_codon:yes stop_codon:yes gene_type:complete